MKVLRPPFNSLPQPDIHHPALRLFARDVNIDINAVNNQNKTPSPLMAIYRWECLGIQTPLRRIGFPFIPFNE